LRGVRSITGELICRSNTRDYQLRIAFAEVRYVAPILLWLIMVLCLLISLVKYLMGSFSESPSPARRSARITLISRQSASLCPASTRAAPSIKPLKASAKAITPTAVSKLLPGRLLGRRQLSMDPESATRFHQHSIRAGRNQFNCGKARTVCNALEHSTAEVIISIDSDCIFHPMQSAN